MKNILLIFLFYSASFCQWNGFGGYNNFIQKTTNESLPWSPSDLSSLLMWYKAGEGITGNPVTAWADASANGYNLTSTGATGYPELITAGLNGYNTIRFDGTSDILRYYTESGFSQPLTVYLVFKNITWVNGRVIFSGYATSGTLMFYNRITENVVRMKDSTTDGDYITMSTDAFYVVTVIWSASIDDCYINNTKGTSSNLQSDDVGFPQGFSVGSLYAGSGQSNIEVAEIIVYNAAHDDANMLLVRTYLYNKFSITP